jgi:hypothetical protein
MMHLKLIKNNDDAKITLYKLARIIYAETRASSLTAVESLASMISNRCLKMYKSLADISADAELFESLNKNSARHDMLLVSADSPGFQMCLRTVQKMINGNLPDSVFGATQFHRIEFLPDWAVSRGYIAECDGMLFYIDADGAQ